MVTLQTSSLLKSISVSPSPSLSAFCLPMDYSQGCKLDGEAKGYTTLTNFDMSYVRISCSEVDWIPRLQQTCFFWILADPCRWVARANVDTNNFLLTAKKRLWEACNLLWTCHFNVKIDSKLLGTACSPIVGLEAWRAGWKVSANVYHHMIITESPPLAFRHPGLHLEECFNLTSVRRGSSLISLSGQVAENGCRSGCCGICCKEAMPRCSTEFATPNLWALSHCETMKLPGFSRKCCWMLAEMDILWYFC